SVVEPSQLAMPEPFSSSLHEKFTPTSELFQPLAFAAGVRLPTIVGLVLSIMTLTECASSTLPPTSGLQNQGVVVPAALMVMLVPACGDPPLTVTNVVFTPERSSTALKL